MYRPPSHPGRAVLRLPASGGIDSGIPLSGETVHLLVVPVARASADLSNSKQRAREPPLTPRLTREQPTNLNRDLGAGRRVMSFLRQPEQQLLVVNDIRPPERRRGEQLREMPGVVTVHHAPAGRFAPRRVRGERPRSVARGGARHAVRPRGSRCRLP